ncbi:MAG: homoserine kinase [Ilumatobacter sp.]|nr:homoserine kinase [Ilumatobacter sp.]
MSTPTWSVRVPASSANLGSGFDVLGMALSVHAEVGVGPAPGDAQRADEFHPATIAFRRLGGEGDLWVRSSIPMGRGMGFSGAVRVGGAAAAVVQSDGRDALDGARRDDVMRVAAELEGHADNAAASLYGGVVITVDDRVTRVPLAFDPAVVMWIPDSETTSTDHSRTTLEGSVSRADAVYNLGRVAMFVAACASGDVAALRTATEDRLHQPARLAAVPETAAALQAALDVDVWAGWLSGSGPSVAMLCESARADEVAASLPATGHTKVLHIDHEGATLVEFATTFDD